MNRKPRSLHVQNMHIGSHIILCIWAVIVIFPLWVMVINSLKDGMSIYKNTFGLPEVWNFSNYTDVLTDGDFMKYFFNSFVAVVSSLTLVIITGTLAAYALANWRGKVSTILFYFFIIGMMLPIKIASIKLLDMMKTLNLLNSIWSLVPIYVAMGIPISIFVLTEFVKQIPHELTEVSLLDGASRPRILVSIIMPLLRPAIATVAIYNLVPFWNDLWFPLIFINDESSKTLLLGVTRLFGQYQTDWSKVLAVLTLSAIPVMGLYLIMSKQFIKGLTAGAIKG